MRNFVAKIVIAVCFMLSAVSASAAEKVTFTANSPLMVPTGKPFSVEFSLNAMPESGTFKAPSFEGFDVLAGPSESRGQSIQSINGTITRAINYTITYVLLPQDAGTVTIGAAEIVVDGKTYRTNSLPIEVVAEGGQAQQPQQSQSGSQGSGSEVNDRIAGDDILLRTVVSRTSVYKGEPLHVQIKLYHRVAIVDCSFNSAPSFNGFWAQDITDTTPIAPKRETVNGKVYETGVLKEYLLYPQQSGTLTIDPVDVTAVAQVIVQSRSRDPFFGGGHEALRVPRKVLSPRMNITVKNLPAGAPASFSGAVGHFSMDATYPAERFGANSAATYTVKISGTGNLTFIQAPKLLLPTSFEAYNVKTTESINPAAGGISGYRQFEYPFIARAEGSYDIEPVEFSYFDPSRMEYMTLHTKPLSLDITPDANGGGDAVVMQGRGMSKEEIKLLGQDIRFIKLGGAQLRTARVPFMFSTAYWSLLGAIVLFFGATYVALRRRIRESHNVVAVRGKRANKVAVQRFRTAKRYMEEQNRHAFYEEMFRALWGYMSDKFNIPVANLTKENVREELHKRGIAAEELQRFTAIITKCDEAQYSPAAGAQMSEVYTEGLDIVSRIEQAIKR